MLEDKWLIYKLIHGGKDALRTIYEKYKNDLLALATALCGDRTAAEDVVHDVFVSFAGAARGLRLNGSLKSYLSTSVANRVRSLKRNKAAERLEQCDCEIAAPCMNRPDTAAVSREELQRVGAALDELEYEQREVIILHLHNGLKFREIAASQSLSVNTIQSRYRYGLNKLRSILENLTE